MVAPVGFFGEPDHDFLTQKPQFKSEPASPSAVREILEEQRVEKERLEREEAARMAQKRLASEKWSKLEKVQDQVRLDSTRLIKELWAVPAKNWDEHQIELYGIVTNWLKERDSNG